jgi:hypothetical protein
MSSHGHTSGLAIAGILVTVGQLVDREAPADPAGGRGRAGG